MPLYEYQCLDCGKRSEILVRTQVPQPVSCPECGSTEMEKQISVPGVIIKSPQPSGGNTCCGRNERCQAPPCGTGDGCQRDH